jgi:hypothetical protein
MFAAEVDRKEISHESWERSRGHASPLARARASQGAFPGAARVAEGFSGIKTDVLGLVTWSSPA